MCADQTLQNCVHFVNIRGLGFLASLIVRRSPIPEAVGLSWNSNSGGRINYKPDFRVPCSEFQGMMERRVIHRTAAIGTQRGMLSMSQFSCQLFLLACDEIMTLGKTTAPITFLSFPDKVNCNKAASLESKSSEERKSIFVRWSMELLAAVDTWSQSLEDGVFKTRGQ